MSDRSYGRVWAAALLATAALCASGLLSASASAASAGTGWMLNASTYPTSIAPGGTGTIVIDVMNVGAASSSGPVTVTDVLPPGVKAVEAGEFIYVRTDPPSIGHRLWSCSGTTVVTCTNIATTLPSLAGGGGTPSRSGLDPEIGIVVKADSAEGSELNHVTIAGGGAAASASTADPIAVSSSVGGFRFTNWNVWFSNADGTLDTQAGSHPYEASFSFALANELSETGFGPAPVGGEVREIDVELPPGFIGDPNAVPQCRRVQLDAEECPPESQIGVLETTVVLDISFETKVYNMVPPPGVPDEIGFLIEAHETRLDTSLRSGGDYGLTTHAINVPQSAITATVLTIWGVPGEASHDAFRALPGAIGKPFLTLPTSCTGPLKFAIRADSWEQPDQWTEAVDVLSHDSNGTPMGLTGCERLSFGPTITAAPDTAKADTPAGLTVEVKPTTGGLLTPEGLGTTDIKNTTVTLPAGVAINPGQAAGLVACQESEANVHVEESPVACPAASKVGTDEVELPILESALKGSVYVLQSNPPELKLLIQAAGEGVEVKLVAAVHLNERTGQLTTTLLETPQAPVGAFRLAFSGGAQAALATPTKCGTYETTSDFTPWATPFAEDLFPSSSFQITSGTDGAPCPPTPLPFTPTLIAGSTTDQAGGYTDFSLLLQAPDDQQRVERLQFKTPEGLEGMIAKVPLCTNTQAEANTCPAASQIGHTVVASGPGPYPLVVPQPGQPPAPIYLTEGYEGAPYGLSIVVPLHVGPFVLPTQRVRAKIAVDQLTAQLTVTTDPLPQVVAGVPTDLRSIDAVIDKPGFMFNPTGCSPRSFSGTAFGTEGAHTPISSPFQMGSCRALLFKPNLKAFTSGKTSRANGASLGVRIVYPTGELGANQASSQSNIQSVKVELPKRLPSRLTTLQKACTAAQFNANPAGCPAASIVGHATAITPVLPVPLTGPAYFVSNGNESFPNLIVVLQGYGVTVHLVGDTFISKKGITSSTFKQVPDVPIGSFELVLPEGPYSALAANGNLCKDKLAMPTDFVAQNGAELKQSTPITTSGCAKAKKADKRSKKHAKKYRQKTNGRAE